jgi:hypothetical protein
VFALSEASSYFQLQIFEKLKASSVLLQISTALKQKANMKRGLD